MGSHVACVGDSITQGSGTSTIDVHSACAGHLDWLTDVGEGTHVHRVEAVETAGRTASSTSIATATTSTADDHGCSVANPGTGSDALATFLIVAIVMRRLISARFA